MTEFVKQNLQTGCAITQIKLLNRYVDFINRLLELWMFIPCENNVPLEEPSELDKMRASWMDNPIDDNFYKVQSYNKAKSRVLFEGFSVEGYEYGKYITIRKDNFIMTYDLRKNEFLLQKDWNIERLSGLKSAYIFLTPNAVKQIYEQ